MQPALDLYANVDPPGSGENAAHTERISFGPFTLVPAERRLEKCGCPINIGGRAFDTLTLLVERAGEVVSKKDILDRVWPKIAVDEVSLRVHIAALRKALCDDRRSDRYVATVAGRGYCFVAPVVRSRCGGIDGVCTGVVAGAANLQQLMEKLRATKSGVPKAGSFVSIAGPKGIREIGVAATGTQELLQGIDRPMIFVDLGSLADLPAAPHAIASALGLATQGFDVVQELLRSLEDKRIVLLIDGCKRPVENDPGSKKGNSTVRGMGARLAGCDERRTDGLRDLG